MLPFIRKTLERVAWVPSAPYIFSWVILFGIFQCLTAIFQIGEIFITDDCSQRCQCTESSTVSCTTIGCGSDEICNVSNYTRGCYKSESTTNPITLPITLSLELLLIGHYWVWDGWNNLNRRKSLSKHTQGIFDGLS